NDEEFALYDQLLRELAAKASGVPVGSNPTSAENVDDQPASPQLTGMIQRRAFRGLVLGAPGRAQENPNAAGARSGEYVQVLGKYLSRLASLNRPLDALRGDRTEIDCNPKYPRLYQRFAAFLEQNTMARDVEEVYTNAIARFADRSWYH